MAEMTLNEAGIAPEEDLVNEEEQVTGSVITHSIEDLPELANMQPGDTITLRINASSEDGKSFDLEVLPIDAAEQVTEEVAPAAAGSGVDAIRSALAG